MRQFDITHQVPHSAGNMFALIADVERYPEFVPLCQSLTVRSRQSLPDGREVLIASMTVAYKMLHESFTSRVTLDRRNLEVLVEYIDGPFKSLENRWTMQPRGENACEVDFFIAYEFSSRTMQMLVGGLFDRAFAKFVDAFEDRADEVYGRRPAAESRVTAS